MPSALPASPLASLLNALATQRRVFVSRHDHDAAWHEQLSRVYHQAWELVRDRSLDGLYGTPESDDEYIMRQIRENHIAGTSCTLVLCGPQTWQRKYVDWEIYATLNKEHGLLGINLPTNPLQADGRYWVPPRLFDNWQSRYAVWAQWKDLATDPALLPKLIEQAIARDKGLIDNSRRTMGRNLSRWGT